MDPAQSRSVITTSVSMRSFRLPVLSFLWLAVLQVVAAAADAPKSTAVRNVTVEEFDKLRADKSNVVLDVRTPAEYDRGHIPGAVNIDFNSSDFARKVGELDKSKTYLVHCA